MHRAGLGLVLIVLALGLAATATGGPEAPAAIPGCAKSSLNLVKDGQLSLATDNPAFPPWWGGAAKKPWQVSNPASGQGYESAVAYAVAKQLGFSKGQVAWSAVPFNNSFRPGKKPFDFYMAQVSFAPERAKNVVVLELVLLREPGCRGQRRHADLAREDGGGSPAVQAGRPGRDDELQLHHAVHQALADRRGLRLEQRRDLGVEGRSDRRHRGRPADGVLRRGRAARRRRRSSGSCPSAVRASTSAWSSRRGTRSSAA